MTVTRCVNLDWLEVACLEPKSEPRNMWFWQKAGFEVHQRDYGTRVFGEVLTLYDTHGEPFLEIRRAPKTTILIPEYCTLRLVNRYCYFDNAAAIMRNFMQKYDYFFQRIARVDICLDFEKFVPKQEKLNSRVLLNNFSLKSSHFRHAIRLTLAFIK